MRKKSPIDMLDTFGEDRVLGISIKSLIAVGMTIEKIRPTAAETLLRFYGLD